MLPCTLCPRKCNIDRTKGVGFCGAPEALTAAKACLHFWEEPCISGLYGAGTVFFSGCNLRCIYCQNKPISREGRGKEISVARLAEIFAALADEGAECIDLVTPTHYADKIAEALRLTKLPIPVVYNCGGYERVETLRRLEGLVDVYLPDFKYADAALAKRLSNAPDYPETALSAIAEMLRQTGPFRLNEDGLLTRGVLVRHLVLPGFTENSLDAIDRLFGRFSQTEILFSLMSQYTPPAEPLPVPSLNRRLTPAEYERVTDYLYLSGVENGYVQELSSAKEEYTPDFDLGGL